MASKYSGLLYRTYITFCFSAPLALCELSCNVLNNLGLYSARKYAKLPASLAGKTVVITGANTGIGKETARAVVQRGGSVIMACRDTQRANDAVEDLVKTGGQELRKRLSVVECKLDDLASVRKAANEINSQIKTLDVLINNAGVMMCPEWTTKDGYEYQFGTNHLGHFLFTLLLLPKLQSAPPGSARIVNLSSLAHIRGDMHFDNLNLTGVYNPSKSYARSKLANILFTRELAKRLRGGKGNGIKVYAVHPGIVATELTRHFNAFVQWILTFMTKLMFINPVEGAQTSLYCGFDESVANQSGYYYANCAREEKLPVHATDDEDAERLWDLSLKLCDVQSDL